MDAIKRVVTLLTEERAKLAAQMAEVDAAIQRMRQPAQAKAAAPVKRKRKPHTEVDHAAVARLNREGLSDVAIGRALGISDTAARLSRVSQALPANFAPGGKRLHPKPTPAPAGQSWAIGYGDVAVGERPSRVAVTEWEAAQ